MIRYEQFKNLMLSLNISPKLELKNECLHKSDDLLAKLVM